MQHRFVEYIPELIEENTLYVSFEYCTAVHLCMCGCGNKVVTPFSSTDWKITFDGETLSLSPSIGNWSFECLSHYWIKKSKVRWAGKWSEAEIEAGRKWDREIKESDFEIEGTRTKNIVELEVSPSPPKWWQRLFYSFIKRKGSS